MKNLKRRIMSPFVISDYFKFRRMSKTKRFALTWSDFYPCIFDKTIFSGFDRHYVYHTAWAARKVKEINPGFHTDISSSLFFSGLVSAFVPVKFYDFRLVDLGLSNLSCGQADLTNLPFADSSIESVSCMHTVEHVGLGRYGDAFDYDGDLKAIGELKRVLAKRGNLIFVVPVGAVARIEFNAHRIYEYSQILNYFSDLELREFALIPENHGLMLYGDEAVNQIKYEKYACGCFWFLKKS